MAKGRRTFTFTTVLRALFVTLLTLTSKVMADVCGTKFTDLTSSAVLAQVIIKGSIRGFNLISFRTRTHSANITVGRVYKGESVLAGAALDDVIVVRQFGEEDRERCVDSTAIVSPEAERIFFLRQSGTPRELQISAFPVLSDTTVVRRVRRSLCPTCIRPPNIRKVECRDCAKSPIIRDMRSRNVKMGRRARLRCTAVGEPKPKFTWSKNGIPVVSGSGGIIIRDTDTSSSLHFRRTMDAHAGEYMCKAENEIGEMEKSVTLELTRRRITPSRRRPNENRSVDTISRLYQTRRNPNHASRTSEQVSTALNNDRNTRQPAIRRRTGIPVSFNSSRSGLPTVTLTTTSRNRSPWRSSTVTRSSQTSSTSSTTTPNPPVFRSTNTTLHVTDGTVRPVTRYPRKHKVKNRQLNRRLKHVFCTGEFKHYCSNGGKCKYIVKLNVRYCQCRTGFAGKLCDIKV